jgi:hypothetical protein
VGKEVLIHGLGTGIPKAELVDGSVAKGTKLTSCLLVAKQLRVALDCNN